MPDVAGKFAGVEEKAGSRNAKSTTGIVLPSWCCSIPLRTSSDPGVVSANKRVGQLLSG